jgi:hypothetical protein
MSSIVYSTIDEKYPVAGQDNNSQGFRDNFTIIKDALSTTKSEIGNLETNTAKLNADNDFNGVIIANAEVRRLYGSVSSLAGVQNGAFGYWEIDTRDADYFYATVTGAVTLRLSNWPLDGLARSIRIQLDTDGNAVHNVTFSSSSNSYVLKTVGFSKPTFQLPQDTTQTHMFEVSSIDGGDTLLIRYTGPYV